MREEGWGPCWKTSLLEAEKSLRGGGGTPPAPTVGALGLMWEGRVFSAGLSARLHPAPPAGLLVPRAGSAGKGKAQPGPRWPPRG